MKAPKLFSYDYDTVAQLAGVSYNAMVQAAGRGEPRLDDLASVCVWLAEHGRPALRAEMASRLVPTVLGVRDRSGGLNVKLNNMLGFDLLVEIFERAQQPEKLRRKRMSRTKRTAKT